MGAADKINILIVDNLPENLLVLSSILEELGENVVTAQSVPEALRRVLEYDFAVILLDVNMPGMNGFETAELIRQRRKSAHTPIIFITALADEMHTQQGYSLGAVDFILTPVVPTVLRTKVRVFVDLYRMTQQVKQQADERIALEREQAARAAAEEATRRSAFLAQASTVLSNSLDIDATRRDLLRLVVPALADVAEVTLLPETGQVRQSELAWARGKTVRLATLTDADRPDDPLRAALERVLASGKAERLDGLAVPYPPAGCTDEGQGKIGGWIRRALLLPLRARGRTLGVLLLAQGESGRSFPAAERSLAEDLAERAAIALDNARLYSNIQEADRHKNEFLSMLAHELRNPLAPIRNALEILRLRGGEDPDLRSLREIVERQVQQLVRLVDDLLDLSRITRGKIRLQMECVDMAGVLAHAVETSRPLIEARRHQLTVSVPSQPLCVCGDWVRLAQIVSNLLNNAAKYTEEGGRIQLSAERRDGEVIVRVEDNGIGIPRDMLSSIFELFTQVDRSLDRSQGGLGIGLTLVHKLVEQHGGRVQAASAGANQGSTFVVHLPELVSDEEPVAAGAERNGEAVQQHRRRVLVVDDNADAARSLAMLLELGGHEVRLCYDGDAALTETETFHPDVVFLDIGLPGRDGLEVARDLRMRALTPQPVLVALTGYGQAEDVRRSREAGFDHHLVKPADPEAVKALLATVQHPV